MPKYGKFTLGQIEAVLNKIGGEDGMNRLLAGEVKVVPVSEKVARRPAKPGVLVRDGSFSAVTLVARHDPRKFYQTKGGFYVWTEFVERIVMAAEPTEAGRKFKKTSYWKLERNATGEMLKSERPRDIWTATDFCAWLSVKMAGQPNGESGELLSSGWANLFLVEGVSRAVFPVLVYWHSVARGWRVLVWDLDFEWDAGGRFVSKPIVL